MNKQSVPPYLWFNAMSLIYIISGPKPISIGVNNPFLMIMQ